MTDEAFDICELDKEFSKRGMSHFLEMAWHIVEPARQYVPNWHIDAICEHLDATLTGDIRRLVINVPPGSTKSLSCSVMFPAYVWSERPAHRFINSSFNEALAKRDSLKCRRLLESSWYQERWGRVVKLQQDHGYTLQKFGTENGGFRMMTTVAGGVTGEHADTQIVDDPIKPLEVSGSLNVSKGALRKVLSWWTETMATRLVDLDKSVRIIIMQRLHVNDLAGAMLKEGGWEHLCLPLEYEPKRKCITIIGFADPRTEPGELLCPARVSTEAVTQLKKELGSRGYRAQGQQDPVLQGGNIFKREHAKYWTDLPRRFDRLVQSWDCAFKGTDTSDFVVGQVWGLKGADYYLLDQERGRYNMPDTCAAVRRLSDRWPKAIKKYVEDKANGPAVVDTLKKKISGFELINPEGGKESRANAVTPLWEGGNVYIPTKENAPWLEEFLVEVEQFPAGANDDQVDAMTQALVKLYRRNIDRLRKAMAAVRV